MSLAVHEGTRQHGSPGRVCPIGYRYAAGAFSGSPELRAATLYIVGGLYGNVQALDAILALAQEEATPPVLVFNGDFHWFDASPDLFRQINEVVLRHIALAGNVEVEIASPSAGAGCGCAYPEWVDTATVDRSNEMIARLRDVSRLACGEAALFRLPRTLLAEVAGARVAVLHGDAESLAGWRFSQEHVRENAEDCAALLEQVDADVVASSHTCLPVAQVFDTSRGGQVLINNGAAGMPNFAHSRSGLITRISTSPHPGALYRARRREIIVEALPVCYDHDTWLTSFDGIWPAGSAAACSYRDRIIHGPNYRIDDAARAGFIINKTVPAAERREARR